MTDRLEKQKQDELALVASPLKMRGGRVWGLPQTSRF